MMIKDEDKTLEQLRDSIAIWEGSEKVARKAFRKAKKKLERVCNRLDTLKNLRDVKIIQGQSEVDWEWFLDQKRETPESYEEANKAIAKYKLAFNGYYPATMQKCVQISMGEQDGLEDLDLKIEGIKTLLPFMKSVKDVDLDGLETIPFGIMENSLSEFGVYSARYIPSTKEWALLVCAYSRVRELKRFPDLDRFLIYLQNKHPYPTGEW